MKYIFLFLSGMILLLSSGCSTQRSAVSSKNVNVNVSWEIIENYYQKESQNLSRFVLRNAGKQPFSGEGWKMHFNFLRPIKSTLDAPVEFKHISGDFFEMSPMASFPELAPGDSLVIEFVSAHTAINISDAPSGLYFVFKDGSVERPGSYSILPFTEPEHTTRGENDHTPLATPSYIFKQNEHLTTIPSNNVVPIVPSPVSYQKGSESVEISASHSLNFSPDLAKEAEYLRKILLTYGLRLEGQANSSQAPSVTLVLDKKLNKPEAYTLRIGADGNVRITGADAAGVFYGIQSLISLISVDEYTDPDGVIQLSELAIQDHPRFPFRGMFLDVSRNFHTKEAVLKLLDLMAHYKLNRFHIHLADDEGWRIEIPGLPELTNVGSRRGHTLNEENMLHPSYGSGPFVNHPGNHGTGYYSTEDFIEILRYAADRHIEVIPEIDVPGHSRAAIKSMLSRYHRLKEQGKDKEAEQYLLTDLDDPSEYTSVQNYDDNAINPCRTSTYTFMDKVIGEIQQVYEQADVPFTTFHIGGDEVPAGVWSESPSCLEQFPGHNAQQIKQEGYAFFVDSVSAIVEKRGLKVGGWEDIGVTTDNGKHVPDLDLAERDIIVNTWNSIWGWGQEDLAYELANAGYEVVLSNATNFYFDQPIHKHPQEPGLYWAAFVNTKNAFEFTPMDLFKSAYVSRMGDTLSSSQWKGRTALSPAGKNNIQGIQAQLWSETVRGQDRMEYMIFPRLLALAERSWAPQPSFATIDNKKVRELERDKAWNLFANSIGQFQLPKLDYYAGGVGYNIPTPGAIIEDGKLRANVTFPGLIIRYTTDGSEPNAFSPVYVNPVDVSGTVKLKSFTISGYSSRTVIAN